MDEVSKLGPQWMLEIIRMVQGRRDVIALSMRVLKPEGEFAKQHQMAIDVCDRMLVAANGGA